MRYRPSRGPRNGPLFAALTGILITASFAHPAEALTTTTSNSADAGWTYDSPDYTVDNGNYGADYGAGYTLEASPSGMLAGASGYADAIFNGKSMSIVTAAVTATGTGTDESSLGLDLTVLGATLVDTTVTDPNATLEVCVNNPTDLDLSGAYSFSDDIEVDALDMSDTFVIWVVPITVDVAAQGCLGVQLQVTYTTGSSANQLAFVATPFVTLGVTGSIGVGTSDFSVGVEGTVDFLDLTVPVTLALDAELPSYDLKFGDWGIVDLTTLNGTLQLYAQALTAEVTDTIYSWNGYSLGSWVIFTDSTPQITNQTINASVGYATTASYTYTDSNNLTDQSTFIWYQATDANGDNSTQVSTSANTYDTTSNTWNIMPLSSDSTNGGYAKYCVTPNNGLHTGTQQCSSWLSLGKLAELFDGSGYSGSNYNFAYQASGVTNGTCFDMPSGWYDKVSSFEIYAPSSSGVAFDFYNYGSCSSELMPGTIAAGGSSLDSSLGSKHDDATNSIRIAAPDTVSASSVSLSFSANTATGSYTYGGAGFTESGSTYAFYRSASSSGSNSSEIASGSTSYTLQPADNEEYIEFCVSPQDEFGTTGSQTCSGFVSVGHLVEVYQNDSYGGSSLSIAYEKSSSGTCFNMTNYSFNDEISSFKFYGTSTNASTVWMFQNTNCQSGNTGAETATYTESTNGVELSTATSSTFGSSWNDSISSFMVTWD